MHTENRDLPRVGRNEAATRGLSRFYSGLPCKAGHRCERYVSNRQCVECNAVRGSVRERLRSLQRPAEYRMYRSVQRRSGQFLKGTASPVRALGCTRSELYAHIERQFRKGMCWSKYRQWEVDHIIPLSAAKSAAELVRLCHYTNLQPLWKQENISKGGA